jgi:hypothetical protein
MKTKDGSLPDIDIGNVPIELPDGRITNVDLNDKNSAIDISFPRFVLFQFQSKWIIYSAFHKSIRLGDMALSLNWGRVLAMRSSPSIVLNYVCKILFEETRNLSLFFQLAKNELQWEDAIIKICASKKKWELDYYQNHFSNWNQGYLLYLNKKKNGYVFDYDDLSNILDQVKDVVEIYALNDFLHAEKKSDDRFYDLLRVKYPEHKLLQNFITALTSDFGARYRRLVSLEILYGVIQDEGSEYHLIPENKPLFFIPAKRLWMFDIHVKGSKKMIIANYNQLRPGPNYNFPQLDLRLSGMLIAILFRFMTRTNLLQHEWTSVVYSDLEWENLKKHEQNFYDI